jgi:hypothetical protein
MNPHPLRLDEEPRGLAIAAIARRDWLKTFGLAGLLLSSRSVPALSDRKSHASRKQLAGHKNLFNGDSCTYFYNPELWQPEGGAYSAKAIHRFVDRLADNGVDTFLINPNAQTVWYPSKKLPTVIDGYKRGDREYFRGHAVAVKTPPEKMDAYLDNQVAFFNLYLDLVESGVDWLAETSKACRRRGISPWVSIRMNDMHGAENPEGSHFNCPLFKNPKYRLSGTRINPRDGAQVYWQALNYERQEVRDFMFSVIREPMEDYDFDGLELDWLRNPHCCEPNASRTIVNRLTGWFGELRTLTEARSKKIGRPVPFGLRIPGNLGYLRSIGIDVPDLARRGLIDFVTFSNFWQTSWDMPYDRLRADLGSDVAIYGCVEDAPNWVSGRAPKLTLQPGTVAPSYPNLGVRYLSASAELLRGNAAGKLAMGVDGIETFNFFCTDQVKVPGLQGDYAALRQLEDLASLRGKLKHYALSTTIGRTSQLWELPYQVPVILEPNWRREFILSMCREPAIANLQLTVQVVFEKKAAAPDLGVSFNGGWPNFEAQISDELVFPTGPYTHHVPEHQAFNFQFNVEEIKEGWNTLVVFNNSQKRSTTEERQENSVHIVSIELGVKKAQT